MVGNPGGLRVLAKFFFGGCQEFFMFHCIFMTKFLGLHPLSPPSPPVCTYDAVVHACLQIWIHKNVWQTDVDIKESSHGKSYLKFCQTILFLFIFLAEHFHFILKMNCICCCFFDINKLLENNLLCRIGL